MLRTRATAEYVAGRSTRRRERRRLIEIAHGRGRPLPGRARRNDPERYGAWREDPAQVAFEDGETLAEVRRAGERLCGARSIAATGRRARRHADAVVRFALVVAQRPSARRFWKVGVENAAFATLASDGSRLGVLDECFVEHLRELRADITEQAL